MWYNFAFVNSKQIIMKTKTFLLVIFVGIVSTLSAQMINCSVSEIDSEYCRNSKFGGSFTFEHIYMGDNYTQQYMIVSEVYSECIEELSVTTEGPHPNGGSNAPFSGNIITLDPTNTGTFTVDYAGRINKNGLYSIPVSYTHLTLPTKA